MAQDKDLDLVLVSPNQEPPVAKILDYGKYKYEINKRAKEARKKQKVIELKEIKIRYKIDVHDYNVRIKSIKKFLADGNKVKIVVMLRGREMQHNQLAYDLAERFLADLKDEKMTIEKNLLWKDEMSLQSWRRNLIKYKRIIDRITGNMTFLFRRIKLSCGNF